MKKTPLVLRITDNLRAQLSAAAELAGTTPNTVAVILLAQALDHGKSNTSEQHIRGTTQPEVVPSATELVAALEAQDAANVAEIMAFMDEEK